jgi:hypothetical protein
MVERVVLNALAEMPLRRLISAPSEIVNIGFGEADPPLMGPIQAASGAACR